MPKDEDKSYTKSYWESYYSNGGPTLKSSSFAEYVLPLYKGYTGHLLDIGCGNGRDSLFFFSKHVPVVAVDQSTEGIKVLQGKIEEMLSDKSKSSTSVNFDTTNEGVRVLQLSTDNKVDKSAKLILYAHDFSDLTNHINAKLSICYSRFTLHAVNKIIASRMLNWAAHHLEPNGLLCIEARSVKSDMYGKGTKVDGDENKDAFINGHYRRFIRMGELQAELKSLGFKIIKEEEKKGVAVYKNDDPVVVRVIAQKIEKK